MRWGDVLPSIERADAARTVIVPRVQPRGHRSLRTVLPWVGFGLLSAVVIAGTTFWSASLRPAARAPENAAAAVLPVVTTTPTAPLPAAVPAAPASAVPGHRPTAQATRRTVVLPAPKSFPVRVEPVAAAAPTSTPPSSGPTTGVAVPSVVASSASASPASATACAQPVGQPACGGRDKHGSASAD